MDFGRALGRGLLGAVGGAGEGVAQASKTQFEQSVLSMREENLARFKQGLDVETARIGAEIKDEFDIKSKGREDYAVGKDGSILTRAEHAALPPEEKGAYTPKAVAEEMRKERKLASDEKKNDAQVLALTSNANSTAIRAEKYGQGGGEKPMTEAQREEEVYKLRKEGKDILPRATMGEDISADADWYNNKAAKIGLPEIRQNTKTVPGKKGLIWDDADKQESSWGFSNSQAAPPAASPAATAPVVKAAPTPKTQAEFDALPPGAVYTSPDDGKSYKKPEGKAAPVATAPTVSSVPAASPVAAQPEKTGLLSRRGDTAHMTPDQQAAYDKAHGGGAQAKQGLLSPKNDAAIRAAEETKARIAEEAKNKGKTEEAKEVERLSLIASTLKAKKARGALSTGKDQADYERAVALELITEPSKR